MTSPRSRRWVSVALPPSTADRYAGVYVYQSCPDAPSDNFGAKKYGWLKSRRTPRSSDDQRTCAAADRAPPRKLRWRYSTSPRAFSSEP